MEAIDFAAILSVALLGSVGHCIGMCGGFVVAYSAAKIKQEHGRGTQFFLHLLYNLGRVSAYVAIGAVLGLVGKLLMYTHAAQGTLYAVIGALMILTGLSLMGKSRFLSSVEASIASSSFIKRSFQKLVASQTPASFYFLGVLNGFIPCGFVYFFGVSAAATGSPLWGAVVMGLFGLCTVPAMMGLGYLVGFLRNTTLRSFMVKLASLVVVGYGFFMLYKAYIFLFTESPSCH